MHTTVCYLYLFYLWVLPGMGFGHKKPLLTVSRSSDNGWNYKKNP